MNLNKQRRKNDLTSRKTENASKEIPKGPGSFFFTGLVATETVILFSSKFKMEKVLYRKPCSIFYVWQCV